MGVRKRLYHPDEVREKIRTSQIVNRLTKHIFAPPDQPVLSKTQVGAALGLLKKTMPDLQALDATLKGDPEHPLVISNADGQL